MTNETENETYDRIRSFNGVNFEDYGVTHGSIASVLEHGEVINDTGEQYESIQPAVDDAEGWVFVGPGTYYESVNITKDGITVQGAGENTVIDSGTVGDCIDSMGTTGSTIKNISLTSDIGSTQRCISAGEESLVANIHVQASGGDGISINDNSIATNCKIENAGQSGTFSYSVRSNPNSAILRCIAINNSTTYDYRCGNSAIVSNCISINGERGIQGNLDGVIIGNRIHNAADEGINMDSGNNDNIIANNRVSDSTNNDIRDAGTGNVLDSNITGTAN